MNEIEIGQLKIDIDHLSKLTDPYQIARYKSKVNLGLYYLNNFPSFDDFKKDFDNFMALFDKNILTKEQLSEVEYIDLRFGNKVFYKNKTN